MTIKTNSKICLAVCLGIFAFFIFFCFISQRRQCTISRFGLADLYGVNVRDLLLKPNELPQPNLQSYFPVMIKQGKLSENDKKTLTTFIKICGNYDSLLAMENEKNAY